MATQAAPTDQRAGVRPISFVLQTWRGFDQPVTLNIRPTDLTRMEPSRTSVHQTLGRGTVGWIDDFGAGLPSVTIAGHTGWRTAAGSGKDGVQAFHDLNKLLVVTYHEARQLAIDMGLPPDEVKLLFCDMLDDFCWHVAPMSFNLQRSKSQPLLMKYNIQLQAISTEIDNPLMILPPSASAAAGLSSLGRAVSKLEAFATKVQGWVRDAIAFKDALLTPVAEKVKRFVDTSTRVLRATESIVSSIKGGIASTANSLIAIAGDIAQVGVNVFRTLSSIAGLPAYLRSAVASVGAAYNEVVCIFKNSLRPQKTYEDYTGLYGSSNCSSTTGGRPPSAYAGTNNVFSLMLPVTGPVSVSSGAVNGVSALNRADPVLEPVSIPEIGRNLDQINDGVLVGRGAMAA